MDPTKASLLLSFMHHTQVTAVFEILQPSYQHVVDLSYLEKPELNFICWTLPYGAEMRVSRIVLVSILGIQYYYEYQLTYVVSYETLNADLTNIIAILTQGSQQQNQYP